MSRGKYSVLAYKEWPKGYEFKYNCYGKEPEPWTKEMIDAGMTFNDKTMFGNYDEEGYDSYGYSAFDEDGEFVGHGDGIDRACYTEHDYLTLRDLGPYEREHYYD